MARLLLSVLGPLQVVQHGKPVAGFESDKVRALLAYLAVEADRPHRREMLIGLLWPHQPERIARHNLSQALYNLRRTIGDQSVMPPFLLVTPESIQFNRASDYRLDSATFTTLLSVVESHTHRQLEACHSCMDRIQRAVALYRGSFLEGFTLDDAAAFEEWALLEREQFRRQVLDALYHLAEYHNQRGEYEQARQYAWRQVELDPLHEPAHRQLMCSYAWSGRRAAALRQYRECVRILKEEVGEPPSEDTTRLYEAIRARRLPGSPVVAQPLPASIEPSREESAEAEKSVFVTREAELMRLERFLDEALAGRGRVALVVGEAGSGKTALLQAFARRAQQAQPSLVVASGNCNAHTGLGDPYLPFRELLGLLAGDVESRQAGAQARRLRALLPVTVQALVEVGPDLIDTFVPGAAMAAQLVAWGDGQVGLRARLEELVARREVSVGSSSPEQVRLFEQYTSVLKSVAEHQPLLLIVDDWQWADDGSISLLFHLGRRIEGSRILIVGAYRPEDVALGRGGQRHPLEPVVNEFKRAFGDICVDLEQTLEAQGRRFVDALLDSEPNRLGAKFRAALYRQTAGHPLFTVELLRDMQGRGDLVRDAEGRWVEGPALDWEILPARVEAAIAERIGRLDEELREALAIASIEGETFTAEVIAQVQAADRRGIGRRLSTDLDRQHRLVRAEEVRMVGTQRMSRYRFRHFLFQKYVYSHLDVVERAYLHGDVGNVLEALYGDQAAEIAVQLARHFREAGNAAKAVDYLLQAGNKALRLSAHAEAITHLTNGLTLLRALPDTRERARQELGLQLALGPAFMVTRGYASPEVEQAYTRAVELCRRLDEPGQLVLGLWGLWVYHFVCGRLETAYYHIPL